MKELTEKEKVWMPVIYEGGKQARPVADEESKASLDWWLSVDDPTEWRVQIVSVVTNSTTNSTALDIVDKVYEHIKKGLSEEELEKINFQTICYQYDDESVRYVTLLTHSLVNMYFHCILPCYVLTYFTTSIVGLLYIMVYITIATYFSLLLSFYFILFYSLLKI